MERTERWRLLLAEIRDRFCDGNQAELARKIETDASYVNRLFYPEGKLNGKRVGAEIMDACNNAFPLPRGFWDMEPGEAFAEGGSLTIVAEPRRSKKASDITIAQYDAGGGMGRPRVMLADQPGVIRHWNVNHEWLQQNVKGYTSAENLRIVTGFGSSMKPMFNPGDPLLADVGVTTVDQEGVFFFRIGDDGYIKTIQRIPRPGGGRILRAKSRNSEEFDPFDIDETTMDFHVLAKILTVWRSDQV